MLSPQKLVSSAYWTGIVVVALLPSLGSALEHTRMENKHNIHEITPQLSFEIELHGLLLWASVGFLIPVSILIKRVSNGQASTRRTRLVFYIHVITGVLAVILATAGAALSVNHFDNSFNNRHQIIGLAFYGAIWLQALVAILRPHRGSKVSSVWFLFHWMVGTAVSLLGVINVYTGLQAYHEKTSKDVRVWTVVFTFEISVILLAYLLQEKWEYIKKQGIVLGIEAVQPADQEMSPRSNLRKGTATDTC